MKDFIKKVLRQCGLKISRLNEVNDKWYLIDNLLKLENPNVLLDIGSNSGQFLRSSQFFLNYGNKFSRILSFEPLTEPFDELAKTIKNLGISDRTEIHNFALGSESGSQIMHIAPNSVSSSLLKPSSELKKAMNLTNSLEFDEREISIFRFDEIAPKLTAPLILGSPDKYFVKLDVQGFEKSVIDGLGSYLAKVRVALVECSFVETYDRRPLFNDMIKSNSLRIISE